MLYGPVFVADVDKDFELVRQIFDRDYSDRWKPGRGPDYAARPSRPVLGPGRSLGSVIKLLTPSDDYTDAYHAWLASFPDYIFPIVFIIKRFAPAGSPGRWRELFGVDTVNGFPGHELKAFGRKLIGSYLRVGLTGQGWRTFKLRQDFIAADKVQTGDDITASVVVPARQLGPLGPLTAAAGDAGAKFAVNCESRLFQRPDDAVHRGLDRQTEADLARPDNFLSNYEPLTAVRARDMVERVTDLLIAAQRRLSFPMDRIGVWKHRASSPTTGVSGGDCGCCSSSSKAGASATSPRPWAPPRSPSAVGSAAPVKAAPRHSCLGLRQATRPNSRLFRSVSSRSSSGTDRKRMGFTARSGPAPASPR